MSHPHGHERLLAYTKSLALVGDLEAVSNTIPPHRPDLRDQLRRAASSIALNIAEGAGEFSPADKAKFYRYARRSAGECAAILDIVASTARRPYDFQGERRALGEVGALLTAMIKRLDTRKSPAGQRQEVGGPHTGRPEP